MKRNSILTTTGALIAIAIFGVGCSLTTETVDEGFPTSAAVAQENNAAEAEQSGEGASVSGEAGIIATDIAAGTPMPTMGMTEPMPTTPPEAATAEPVALVSGGFTTIDSTYSGSGTATIFELADGERVLRFENFQVTNGPQLVVLLAEAADPRTSTALGGNYINLGALKGNVGDQNYAIPGDVDLSRYNSIVIYCEPFSVVFSTAPLG